MLIPDKKIGPGKMSKRTQRIYSKYKDQLVKMNHIDFEAMDKHNPLGNINDLLGKDETLISRFQKVTDSAITKEKILVKEK